MNVRTLYLFLLVCLVSFQLNFKICGQNPVHYKINDDNNLPSNEVYDVLQDDFGYMWIGCDAGVFKYDGFTFESFTHPNQNGTAISFLKKDNFNNIWCKNFYGQIYKIENQKSLKIVVQKETSNASEPIFDIGTNGVLFYYFKDTLWSIDSENNISEFIETKTQFSNSEIKGLKSFNEKLYLFDKKGSIFNADFENKKLVTASDKWNFENPIDNFSFIEYENQLFVLFEEKKNQSVFHIQSIDTQNKTQNIESITPKNGERIYGISVFKNKLTLKTSKGLHLLSENNDFKKIGYFENEKISALTVDRENQTWLSTLENGLIIIPNEQILQYNKKKPFSNALHTSQLFPLQDSILMLGSYNGDLFSFNLKNKKFEGPKYQNKNETFYSVKKIKKHQNYLIISRGRLTIIDEANDIIWYPKISNVRDFVIRKDTCYMVLPEFTIKVAFQSLLSNENIDFEIIHAQGGKSIAYDIISDRLYFSLASGTFNLDNNGQFKELKIDENSIYSNQLLFQNNKLWISTNNIGVLCFENNLKTLHLSEQNHLKENSIKRIFIDSSFLWVVSKNFIHKYNINHQTTHYFSKKDGIKTTEVNDILIHKNTVYLATHKGIVSFPEALVTLNKIPPTIKVKSIVFNGQEFLDPSIPRISLPFDHKNFTLELSSISLRSRGRYQYHYRLKGFDNSFSSIGAASPYVQFSRLPAGNYTLEIFATNESGVPSESIIYKIVVTDVFWQTWWFYVVLTIVVITIMYFIFRQRIKFIRRKAKEKNQLINAKLTALKAQMNPHFMFNTLNSLQDLILKQDFKSTNYFLSKYATLMRMILHNSEKQFITMSEEIKMLDIYLQLEKLRFGDDFTFEITIDSDSNLEKEIPAMMLQPFVENAIKHGLLHKKGEKHLSISFTTHETFANCIIIDNGIGRDKSTEINKRQQSNHQSFSTDANLKRAALLSENHKNDLNIDIEDLFQGDKPFGTKVSLKLPFM